MNPPNQTSPLYEIGLVGYPENDIQTHPTKPKPLYEIGLVGYPENVLIAINMNVLNAQISFFSQLSDVTRPDNSKTLMQILQCPFLHKKFMPMIEDIRATTDEAKRKELKKKLPVFIPSGIFSQRSSAGLIRHSGLLSFDIDSKENPFLNSATAPQVRDELSGFANVAYVGLSASGAGVWGVIPISNPDDHAGHFRAIEEDFKECGYTIDPACKDVSRARYWSIDTDARFNVLAETYTRTQSEKQNNHQSRPHVPRHTHKTHDVHTEAARVECIIQQIEGRRYDLTGTYTEWFSLGCSIACEFGENGRDMYHRISQYHAEYNPAQTDRQYNYCLSQARHTRTPIGVFFKAAGRAGFMFKGHATPPVQHREQPHEASARNHDEYFEGIGLSGNPIRVLLNKYGYPASWDEPIPQTEKEVKLSAGLNEKIDEFLDSYAYKAGWSQQAAPLIALQRMVKSKPEIINLIERFDLIEPQYTMLNDKVKPDRHRPTR